MSVFTEEIGYNRQDAPVLVTPSRPNNAERSRAAVPIYKPIPTLTLQQEHAFWSRVQIDMYDIDACWPWLGSKNRGGYGQVSLNKVSYRVHRVAYALRRGPVPEGLTLDHICRRRNCCNPDHLEPVTAGVNTLRGDSASGVNARKYHCQKGHVYSFDARGKRECLRCVYEARKQRGFAHRSESRRTRGVCYDCKEPSQSFRCTECRARHNARDRARRR